MFQILNLISQSQYAYALFHFFVLGSIFVSKIFYQKMIIPQPSLLKKIIPASIVFIIWDIVVTNKWWFFNHDLVLNIPRFLGLPIEEILFFFTVPFGILTFLENIERFIENKQFFIIKKKQYFLFKSLLQLFFALLFILFASKNWWYTASLFLGFLYFANNILKISIKNFIGLIFTILTTLIFNYYLTALPIVTYENIYKSSILILTIPIEDFGYGILFYLLIIKFVYAEKKIALS